MRRTSFRSRVLAGVTALAIAGAGSLALAGPAGAVQADVDVTAGNTFLAAGSTDQNIGNVVIVEDAFGDLTTADVCITITSGNATFDAGDPDPAVAKSGDNAFAVSTPATVAPTTLTLDVTAASTTNPATVTVSGIQLDTTGTGHVLADVGVCGGDTDVFEEDVRLAFIGTVSREAGNDRFATAQQIAEGTFAEPCADGNVDDVVIARGDNFPDALAASYLAGVINAPILLVNPTSIPNETLAALKNLGASGVLVIGGEQAISADVFNFLDNRSSYDCDGIQNATSLNADRIFGIDRYATARNVLLHANVVGTVGTIDPDANDNACDQAAPLRTAIVASGENFPDALSAGPLAFAGAGGCGDSNAIPLLLTNATSLPSITATAITQHNIEQVIIMGGPNAVSAGVATAIDNLSGVTNVARVAGPDRQGTAVELTEKILQFLDGDWVTTNETIFVTRPDTFPDALAAAPLAGTERGPLFITTSTSSLGTTAANGIKGYPSTFFFEKAVLLGGEAALTSGVATEVGNALAGQAN